jgi:hypothetical protein
MVDVCGWDGGGTCGVHVVGNRHMWSCVWVMRTSAVQVAPSATNVCRVRTHVWEGGLDQVCHPVECMCVCVCVCVCVCMTRRHCVVESIARLYGLTSQAQLICGSRRNCPPTVWGTVFVCDGICIL